MLADEDEARKLQEEQQIIRTDEDAVRAIQRAKDKLEEDPDDRRVRQIVLTEKGSRVLEEGIRAQQRWLGDLTESLSDAEKETITASLNILIEKTRNLKQPIEVAR